MTTFEDELGTYIGPLTVEETIKALDAHTPGEWVMQLTDPDGNRLWHKTGWSWNLVQNDEEALFYVHATEHGAGNPSLAVDAPVVLSLVKDMKSSTKCSQYSGGLKFEFLFGDYRGHTLTMLAWHSVLHVTPDGDVAPGFGPVEIEVTDLGPVEDDAP